MALFAGTGECLAATSEPLARELDRVGAELCKTFELKCRSKAKSRAKSRKVKSAKAKAATKKPAGKARQAAKAPAPKIKVPVPAAKPAVAEAKSSPALPLLPEPRSKPVVAAALDAPLGPPLPPALPPPVIPLPRDKPPASPVASMTVEAPPRTPPPEPETKATGSVAAIAPVAKPAPPPSPAKTDPAAQCLAALKADGVEFAPAPIPAATGPCQVENPVKLSRIGAVSLPDQPVLNCKFAGIFASWLTEVAEPVVVSKSGSRLSKLATGPGYQCRGRNGDSSAKLSEHGLGNAVDITFLATSDGKTIQIADALDQGSPSHDLLKGLRTSACGYFTTVLGPGANAAHAAHFHFDLGRHGKSDTYRICE
jgi:hypothetical protein